MSIEGVYGNSGIEKALTVIRGHVKSGYYSYI
jgi:hypothetical protein